ncbi:hypothetical protein ADK60_33410 [Streptomyces sp. XY431]|uniref:DUF397 domain-containing protein n=1 Tax=Streptomyces sp. XY431 TaxID=1415562 RepID=UPI0006AE8910|nr:DUF397 domain-containing protein [Streptomyces sp. XY431]KOV12106.1 hypothetical protein ADK60_33410 [Streptomyces sp. XY431]
MEELAWQRPSRCADSSNCPEVAVTGDTVHLRSSLRPTEVTQLTLTEWRDLLAGIRNGEFDA